MLASLLWDLSKLVKWLLRYDNQVISLLLPNHKYVCSKDSCGFRTKYVMGLVLWCFVVVLFLFKTSKAPKYPYSYLGAQISQPPLVLILSTFAPVHFVLTAVCTENNLFVIGVFSNKYIRSLKYVHSVNCVFVHKKQTVGSKHQGMGLSASEIVLG